MSESEKPVNRGAENRFNDSLHDSIAQEATCQWTGSKTVIGNPSTIRATGFLMHRVPVNSLVVHERSSLSILNQTFHQAISRPGVGHRMPQDRIPSPTRLYRAVSVARPTLVIWS
jgi:hypothetical protein